MQPNPYRLMGTKRRHRIFTKRGDHDSSEKITARLRHHGLAGILTYDLGATNRAYLIESEKLMLEGRLSEALDALETEVQMGYRREEFAMSWQFTIRDNPVFEKIGKHPRFVAVVDAIETDIANQREELRLSRGKFRCRPSLNGSHSAPDGSLAHAAVLRSPVPAHVRLSPRR